MDIDMRWLEKNLFHRTLSPDDKRILKGLVHTKSYQKGNTIIEERQDPDGLFILKSGCVALEHQKHGQSVRIAKLTEGAQLGDISLFNQAQATVTVQALDACEVYHFPQKSMTYMMEYRQSLSRDIMLNTIRSLGHAVRQMNESQAYTQQYIQGMRA